MAMGLFDYFYINRTSRHYAQEGTVTQRVNNIRDNFGVQAESFGSYRASHGGSGTWKAIGIVAGGLALGVAAAAVIPAAFLGAGTVIMAGLSLGAIGGLVSLNKKEQSDMHGYNAYLDGVAANARVLRDRGISQGQAAEYDNGAGRTSSHVADVIASRQQEAAAGTTR